MPSTGYILAAVAISTVITWALRAAPFAVLAPVRRSSTLARLDADLPVGVMTILVAYTVLHETPPALDGRSVAAAIALGTTVVVHRWRHNAVLSVVVGTATNVVIASTLPLLGH